jgi:cytochrome P450
LFSTETPEVSVSVQRAFETVWDAFSHYVALPVPPLSIPTPRNLRIRWGARELDQIIYKMLEERRQKPLEQPDLLQLLLNTASEEKNTVMSDRQIRDELVTTFVAGHETTAHALSWFWHVLSEHPDVEELLHQELDEVLGGAVPTVEHLSHLPYLHMVLQETLRLYSPSFSLARHAIADDEVGGYHIPQGSLIFLAPYFTHRHPDFWPEPDYFDPERFKPGTRRHKFAYFPFGGGPRICIGNNFALMEMPLIIAVIAQRYRLRLVPGTRVEPWASLTMRPRYGLPMFLLQR